MELISKIKWGAFGRKYGENQQLAAMPMKNIDAFSLSQVWAFPRSVLLGKCIQEMGQGKNESRKYVKEMR